MGYALSRGRRARRPRTPEIEKPMTPPPEIRTAVADGALLPSTLSPRVGANAGLALGFAGYDGARSAPIGSATAEVRVWGPLAIRGGVEYSSAPQGGPPDHRRPRPVAAAGSPRRRRLRERLLSSGGVHRARRRRSNPSCRWAGAGSACRVWQPGLRPGPGRQRARRRGALRVALRRRALVVRPGLAASVRDRHAEGNDGAAEPKFDLLAGPVASATVGPVAFFAMGGPSVLKVTSSTSTGVAALGGVGSVF